MTEQNNSYGGYSAYNKQQYQRDHDYHLQNGYKARPNQNENRVVKKYTGPTVAKELANTLRDISLQSGSGGTSQTSFSVADVEEAKFIMLRASSSVIGSATLVALIAPFAFWLSLALAPADSMFAILVSAYFFLSSPIFFYLFWSAYTLKESKGFAISDVAKRYYSRYMMIWSAIEWTIVVIVFMIAVFWYYSMMVSNSWIYELATRFSKKQGQVINWLDQAMPLASSALVHYFLLAGGLALLYSLMSKKILARATKEQADRRMEALITELSNAEVAEGILDGKY